MVRMCSSNELDVDQDLPIVPGSASGAEVSSTLTCGVDSDSHVL